MKKLSLLIALLSVVLVVSACSKKEESTKDTKSHSMEGVVKEVDEETFLMESRDKIYMGDVRVSMRTESTKKDEKISVGDIVNVKYDGKMAKSEPAQITGVYSIEIVEKGKETFDDQGNKKEAKVTKEDFYKLPILSVVHGDESRELNKNQSAFIHDVMRSHSWETKYKKTMKGDYKIMDGVEVVAEFDSKNHVIFDSVNKAGLTLDESISEMVREVLDNKKK